MRGQSVLPGNQQQGKRKWPEVAQGEVKVGHCEEFLDRRGWAGQGSGGVIIPGGVQDLTVCGT